MDVIEFCRILKSTTSRLEEILAVEMLEYHNKNWLAGNEGKRNKDRQNELKSVISDINNLVDRMDKNAN